MSAFHGFVRYALTSGNLSSIPDVDGIEERDGLLALLALYGSEPHPELQPLRTRLEAWLEHTLDQRTPVSPDASVHEIAARTHDDIYDWLATSADAEQITNFVRAKRSRSEDMPTSALYRRALTCMLASNPELAPEYLGANWLRALLSGPRHARLVRGCERVGLPLIGDSAAELFTLPATSRDNWHRIVRGARWRDDVDTRFFRDLHTLLATRDELCA